MEKIEVENLLKNIIVLSLLIVSFFQIENFFNTLTNMDKGTLATVLGAVGILSVIACFGNFAFTYEDIHHKNPLSRLIAHVTTGLLMLLIGLTLEMTAVIVKILIGNFFIFDVSIAILYVACVLYDFWDLERAKL